MHFILNIASVNYMKVLLVDDDEDLVNIFSAALNKEGLETAYELTGQQGISKAKEIHPDLILLDQVLPDISGNDILKVLKSDESTKMIPVIILSNFSQEELVKGAIDQGALDYLFKYQVEPRDVVAKVKEALKIG